jgi:hypothetical protein
VDFIPQDEVAELLDGYGVRAIADGESRVLLEMSDEHTAARACVHVDGADCGCDPEDCMSTAVSEDGLIGSAEHALHRLHQGQTVVVPVGKWRSVFDAVAFSLADDEAWQEFDAAATEELNTRDPLLCDANDTALLTRFLLSLMRDGDQPEQGVFLIPAGAPVLVHLQPGGPMRFWFGDQVHADELAEAFAN